MSKNWSFYNPRTGLLTAKHVTCPDNAEVRSPDGFLSIEGFFDHLSQRIDLQTGQVIDYQPPRPDDDHEWNQEARRWQKRLDIMQRETRQAETLASIDELQHKQLRAVTELLANPDDKEARKHFDERQAQIETLRAQL